MHEKASRTGGRRLFGRASVLGVHLSGEGTFLQGICLGAMHLLGHSIDHTNNTGKCCKFCIENVCLSLVAVAGNCCKIYIGNVCLSSVAVAVFECEFNPWTFVRSRCRDMRWHISHWLSHRTYSDTHAFLAVTVFDAFDLCRFCLFSIMIATILIAAG